MYNTVPWEAQVRSSVQPYHGQQCPEHCAEQASSGIRHEGSLYALGHLLSVLDSIFNAKVDEDSKGAPEKAGCSC